MRLLCPRCGAEYEVEDHLIPAGGREVQCSSCDNVWFQLGRLRMMMPIAVPTQARAAEADMPEAPARMGRALPEDVMDILRDEAAHFRASHPGLETVPDVSSAPIDPDGAPLLAGGEPSVAPDESEGDTGSAVETLDSAEPDAAAVEDDRDASPGEVLPTPIIAMSLPVAAAPGEPVSAPLLPDPILDLAPAPEWARSEFVGDQKRGGGFGRGFLIGLLIAGGFYALYRAAPDAGEGIWGDALRSIRAGGDAAHQWVQAQIAAFR